MFCNTPDFWASPPELLEGGVGITHCSHPQHLQVLPCTMTGFSLLPSKRTAQNSLVCLISLKKKAFSQLLFRTDWHNK